MARYFRHREPPLFIVTARKDLLPRFDLSIERVSLSIVFLFERVSPPKFHSRRSSTIHPRIRSRIRIVCCVYFFKKRRYLYINLQVEYRCLSRYLSSRLYILLHIMYIYICIYRFKFWIFRFEKFVRDDWTKLFLSISPETLHKRIKRTESKIV